MTSDQRNLRLVQVDALRGMAALAVVLFHFTTRFSELYPAPSLPSFSAPAGHYGVNLFFIISGFVIFMTLEKTKRPMDFAISRFSRLFPAYWVAVFLTFSTTHLLGLPGKVVHVQTAAANLIMLHGLFHVPHVDGVYWTLEVELLFYSGVLALYRFQLLHHIHHVLLGLMTLNLLNIALFHTTGIEMPWMITRLFILNYIPWFALGIAVYFANYPQRGSRFYEPVLTAACAIFTLLVAQSAFVGGLGIVFSLTVWLAAIGRIPLLGNRWFVGLGAISYPLYLLHENIGWSLQLRLHALGIGANLTVFLAIAVSFALAFTLNRWVEQPAMRHIRHWYRARSFVAVPGGKVDMPDAIHLNR